MWNWRVLPQYPNYPTYTYTEPLKEYPDSELTFMVEGQNLTEVEQKIDEEIKKFLGNRMCNCEVVFKVRPFGNSQEINNNGTIIKFDSGYTADVTVYLEFDFGS